MKENEQLKLQAYLDGELTGREREEVAKLIDAREDVRALLAELQHTRAALRQGEPERRLDCSREFYWSQIERGIESQAVEASAGKGAGIGVLSWMRRHFAQVAGAAAVACLIATLAIFVNHSASRAPLAESEWEVFHPNTGMVNYRDYENGITVVMLYDRSSPDFTSGK